MTTVKEHYDNHLGNFYSWMMGDLPGQQAAFQSFLVENGLLPSSTKIAVDLGAGNGLQSVPLAKCGYTVKAVDFNRQLLAELVNNSTGLDIEVIEGDMRNLAQFSSLQPELILCCGDTITHLDDLKDISEFISNLADLLVANGKLLLTFRNYSQELTGDNRIIPVKSDDSRILTCILDYVPDYVNVTDLLYEKTEEGWKQKISSYKKVRISETDMIKMLEKNRMHVQLNNIVNGISTIIAEKKE